MISNAAVWILLAFLTLSSLQARDIYHIGLFSHPYASKTLIDETKSRCEGVTHELHRSIEKDALFICSDYDQKAGGEASNIVKVDIIPHGQRARVKISFVKSAEELLKDLLFEWEVPNQEFSWRKLLSKFSRFLEDENIKALKEMALEVFVENSNVITKVDEKTYVINETRKEIDKAQAHEIVLDEDFVNREGVAVKRNKKALRSMLEASGILLASGIIYQFFNFSEDADFDYNWTGVKEKFSRKGFRFDDNHRKFNLYAHPFAGSAYYSIGRANGLSPLESMLLTFTSSMLWEFVAEFPEVSSINDQFQTAFTGPAIGEAMFQLGNYIRQGDGGILHQILGGILGPSLHDWFDGFDVPRAQNLDEYGFDANYWHQFDFYTHFAQNLEKNALGVQAGLDLKLNTVRHAHEEGVMNEWRWETLFAELAARFDLSRQERLKFMFYAKTIFAGIAAKDIRETEEGKRGFSLLFGPSSSFSLRDGMLGDRVDSVGLVNFFGKSLDITLFMDRLKINISMDLSASFTSISSYALEKYRNEIPHSVIKAALEKEGYSNGIGVASRGRAQIDYGRFSLDFMGAWVSTRSINGIERNQDEITDDLVTRERRSNLEANALFRPFHSALYFGVGYQRNAAHSSIESESEEFSTANEASENVLLFKFGGRF